jgi:hypothetical protein
MRPRPPTRRSWSSRHGAGESRRRAARAAVWTLIANAARPRRDALPRLRRRSDDGPDANAGCSSRGAASSPAPHTLGAALGTTALAQLLGGRALAAGRPTFAHDALAPLGPHFPARAKRVIYLHMEGAPSQLDLFDYKPGLKERFDQDLPDPVRNGQRLPSMTRGQSRFPSRPRSSFTKYANRADGA